MKRTELIALADAVELQAEDWRDDTDARALARFARQIAQAQTVAARYYLDDAGYLFIDGGSGSNWLTRHDDAEPLYTLPLED